MKQIFGILVLALVFAGCGNRQTDEPANRLYTIKNGKGMEVSVSNFGGRIVSLMVPDKNGEARDVVLGFGSLNEYETQKSDFGAIIGRYGNRIHKGFTLDSVYYALELNDGENSLHGGPTGFQYQLFAIEQPNDSTLICSYCSPDGEDGFPGNLDVKVSYSLTACNTLNIDYEATTDKPTVINLTNHSYFNLSGDPNLPITDHVLYLNADRYTPVNAGLIPTGEVAPVQDTPFDFSTPKAVGRDIAADNEQIRVANGFDHNFVFKACNTVDSVAACLYSPVSGITMKMYTDQPAVQFYTGNFLDGTQTGKQGIVYQQRTGLCLETQHYPDSPNQPAFPCTVLRPGETYKTHTAYKFITSCSH